MNQNGKYLLDTNIATALFAGDPVVQEKVRNAEYIAVAPPIIGELRFGAQKSNKVAENLRKIDIFVQQIIIFFCDLETARWDRIIKDKLRRKGLPIPNNDIWIAAITRQRGLILVTRDSHFDEVESLQVEHWYILKQHRVFPYAFRASISVQPFGEICATLSRIRSKNSNPK